MDLDLGRLKEPIEWASRHPGFFFGLPVSDSFMDSDHSRSLLFSTSCSAFMPICFFFPVHDYCQHPPPPALDAQYIDEGGRK